jgi:FAD/FMN-containing dehydrogenase
MTPAPTGFRGIFRDDEAARAVYSESAGIERCTPLAIAVPADADDVAALVRWAARERVALTARGSGSSMANGATGRGVIVDLSRLQHIDPPSNDTKTIICGPGALRDSLNAAAAQLVLTLPVDPSSGAFATIGGMCATNAAGARSLKYGAMRSWVVALDCVFADGSRAWIRRDTPAPMHIPAIARFFADVVPQLADARESLTHTGVRKESSGYALATVAGGGDLVDLLVGSEGTLALFVGVEVALTSAIRSTASVLASFADLESAVRAAGACAAHGASAAELLDKTFLDVVRAGSQLDVPDAAEAVLIIEAEGASPDLATEQMQVMVKSCRTHGAIAMIEAPDEASEIQLWAIRHAASPTLARLDPNLASMQLVEDGAVPPEHFPAYVRGVREIFADAGLRCVIFGHAGDAHAHVNALVDVRAPEWRVKLDEVFYRVTALVASLGGTIAAEHGDGRLRTPMLGDVWPARALELFAATKRAFDPANTLNPGVKVAVGGQRPFVDLKYDRALAPLPDLIRDALDGVAREKGWARFRLGLIDPRYA